MKVRRVNVRRVMVRGGSEGDGVIGAGEGVRGNGEGECLRVK